MEDTRSPHPTRQAWRTSGQVADEENPKRHLLPLEERLPVAHASTRVPSMVHRTSLLQTMASGWHLGEDQRHAAQKDTHKRSSRFPTERWHPRHPICEDHQRGRYSGLRWGQEAFWQKAICWWILWVWCSKPQCTRRSCKIVQRCLWCWREQLKSSPALSICG